MNYDIDLQTLEGKATSLKEFQGRALLIVNVASRCGSTPQYHALEALQRRYESQGLSVLGFPCNQFGEQEPGTAEQIREFCSTTYDVSFPMFAKLEVKGAGQHPLYAELSQVADSSGKAGAVEWNFEKFLVAADGTVQRFRTKVEPDADEVVRAIEASLPKG
jgi:glutathione peroxidase